MFITIGFCPATVFSTVPLLSNGSFTITHEIQLGQVPIQGISSIEHSNKKKCASTFPGSKKVKNILAAQVPALCGDIFTLQAADKQCFLKRTDTKLNASLAPSKKQTVYMCVGQPTSDSMCTTGRPSSDLCNWQQPILNWLESKLTLTTWEFFSSPVTEAKRGTDECGTKEGR